jgi:hypothetical protein
LPDKVKAIAIYKRYKQIRKIEEEMQAAIREVEKKYLKYDEPVLNSVNIELLRFPNLLVEKDPSMRLNSRISPSISMKKRSRKLPPTSRPARLKDIGEKH